MEDKNNETYASIVDGEHSKETGLLHVETRKKVKDFGLADTYVQATARKTKSVILTGDIHFTEKSRKHFSYCKRNLKQQTISETHR